MNIGTGTPSDLGQFAKEPSCTNCLQSRGWELWGLSLSPSPSLSLSYSLSLQLSFFISLLLSHSLRGGRGERGRGGARRTHPGSSIRSFSERSLVLQSPICQAVLIKDSVSMSGSSKRSLRGLWDGPGSRAFPSGRWSPALAVSFSTGEFLAQSHLVGLVSVSAFLLRSSLFSARPFRLRAVVVLRANLLTLCRCHLSAGRCSLWCRRSQGFAKWRSQRRHRGSRVRVRPRGHVSRHASVQTFAVRALLVVYRSPKVAVGVGVSSAMAVEAVSVLFTVRRVVVDVVGDAIEPDVQSWYRFFSAKARLTLGDVPSAISRRRCSSSVRRRLPNFRSPLCQSCTKCLPP